MMVGVLVPDITNPVFPPMVRGIEDALGVDYTVIVANTDNDPERQVRGARRLLARGVDGLILASVRRHDPLVGELLAAGIPLVLTNRTQEDGDLSAVISDDAQGMRLMVEHLGRLGHRRIAHIAGPQDFSTGVQRQRAFRNAMRAARLELHEQRIAAAKSFSIAEGARLANQLLNLEPRPTALFAANDLLAVGAYEAAANLGLAVPTDVSVTGFNDMPFVDRLTPPLTTIRIQVCEMGTQAALLLKQLGQPSSPRMTINLGVMLLVRGSTAPPSGIEAETKVA
jgi:LacI family transcriptional regulator